MSTASQQIVALMNPLCCQLLADRQGPEGVNALSSP